MNRKVEDYIKSTFSSNHEVMANPTCYIYDLEEVTERINEIDRFKLANVSLYKSISFTSTAFDIIQSNFPFIEIFSWVLINDLYKDFNIHVIEAKRNINSNGKKRGKVEEVIITNYKNDKELE